MQKEQLNVGERKYPNGKMLSEISARIDFKGIKNES